MSIFGDKTDTDTRDPQGAPGQPETAAVPPLPLKPAGSTATTAAPVMPARKPVVRPEIVRRARDYSSGSGREEHGLGAGGGYNDGKKLIVGREIALSGAINACEKLIVQGRVEANMSDCSEIEIAETGTFKGEATVDVAEIDGIFEGTLVARELLLIRANGRVSGTVRFGRLEVERGGELIGDVQVIAPEAAADEA